LPPSGTISNYRIAISPGVQWNRPNTSWSTKGLGVLADEVFVAVEDQQLVGVDMESGDLQWSHPITETLHSALLDVNQMMVYLATSPGTLEAFSLSALEQASSSESLPDPDWQFNLERLSSSTLLPLPAGGMVASTRDQLSALSESGEVLWQAEPIGSVVGWTLANEALIVTTNNEQAPLWSLDEAGATAWDAPITGKPVMLGSQVYLYSEEGVYRLDADSLSAELIYALPKGILKWGDILPIADEGLLVIHADPDDRRLLARDPTGLLLWERSLANLPSGKVQLLEVNDQAYLLVQQVTSSANKIAIYAIDTDQAELTLIFEGGTRNPVTNPNATWAYTIDEESILLSIGGGGMVALNPLVALEVLTEIANSP
jgi:outer membrane protein assembly factor BamB